MQVVYVLQISDDIDKPVACTSELHARDRAREQELQLRAAGLLILVRHHARID